VAEPDGFREFVITRSPALVRSAVLPTGDEGPAHDLVQAALVKTRKRWGQIVKQDAPEAYVRRVIISTFLTWNRRRWRGEQPMA
jgi:DNA-directed RNA polymerase specialized sigma24 family protein